jgi:hypothetical protein
VSIEKDIWEVGAKSDLETLKSWVLFEGRHPWCSGLGYVHGWNLYQNRHSLYYFELRKSSIQTLELQRRNNSGHPTVDIEWQQSTVDSAKFELRRDQYDLTTIGTKLVVHQCQKFGNSDSKFLGVYWMKHVQFVNSIWWIPMSKMIVWVKLSKPSKVASYAMKWLKALTITHGWIFLCNFQS